MSAPQALVVIDDPATRELVSRVLEREACSVRLVSTGHEAMAMIADGADLVLLGDPLPDGDALDVMQQLRQVDPCCPIMLIASSGGVKHAVMALQLGANDYAEKPISTDTIGRFLREVVAPSDASRSGVGRLLGASPAMRRVRALLHRAIDSQTAPVVLQGESGTGKRLAARALHEETTPAGPLLTVGCTAFSPAALDLELFGEGETPGLLERARGGTLHVQDVERLTPDGQCKLLAALDDGMFRRAGDSLDRPLDLRLVVSTSTDLRQAVRDQGFRAELYYRLAVFVVDLPPLRERPGDTELLARRFVLEVSRREQRPPPLLSRDALAALRTHAWPGNVRELRNVLERAVLLRNAPRLHAHSFDLSSDLSAESDPLDLPPSGLDLRQFERRMVEQALRRADGNLTRAARMLGLNRDQMRYRVVKYGLER